MWDWARRTTVGLGMRQHLIWLGGLLIELSNFFASANLPNRITLGTVPLKSDWK
jgi:hypothetical protein